MCDKCLDKTVEALKKFNFKGDIIRVTPFGSGIINDTFLVVCNDKGSKNKYILYGNHLMGVFSAFLNLFHKDCKLTLKQKKQYIKAIVNREYVSECAVNRKRDKGLIGLTALLVRIKNSTIICSVFKGISLVRLVKS